MATISQPHSILHMHSGAGGGMPHGLGLLTTVASLPPKYRSRYLNLKTKSETPLDLSVKQISSEIVNDVPIATSFTEVYTEPSPKPSSPPTPSPQPPPPSSYEEVYVESQASPASQPEVENIPVIIANIHPHQHQQQNIPNTSSVLVVAADALKSITPPLTPTLNVSIKRKHYELIAASEEVKFGTAEVNEQESSDNPCKVSKTVIATAISNASTKAETTPKKPIRTTDSAPKTIKAHPPSAKPLKNKATRKLKFDEETSSPVSGTIIRPLEDITDAGAQYSNGDIDPKYNIVEITEETKAELAAIKNVIGDYVCRLCRIKFDDAFGLARHRCACIVLLEYRCPECGKQFNCPANLASHRRWHKPKKESNAALDQRKENRNTTNTTTRLPKSAVTANGNKKFMDELGFACSECGRKFKRQAYLRKHQLTHSINKTTSLKAPVDENTSLNSYAASNTGTYSSGSSVHSYNETQEEEGGYTVTTSNYGDYEADTMSECSTSSAGYGRLQIVESGLTEEENIAATALTNLRHCASVIQHTTLAH